MIDNEYNGQGERANIRRLGDWGPPNLDSIKAQHPANGVADTETGESPATEKAGVRLTPAAFALILLLFGSIVIGVGVSLVFGIGWGLTTLGLAIFTVGFMTARST